MPILWGSYARAAPMHAGMGHASSSSYMLGSTMQNKTVCIGYYYITSVIKGQAHPHIYRHTPSYTGEPSQLDLIWRCWQDITKHWHTPLSCVVQLLTSKTMNILIVHV